MAEYKLIQDIEAEDKILGPLTLRQFIFALIACFAFYMSFIVATKGLAFLLVLFLPPGIFFGFFALPFGRDQPTEVWFLAKLRFWFKPRRRLWSQDGVKEMVTITVPKKIERVLTNGLSQTEVKSRLHALADTIDSRGWAIKHVTTYGKYTPAMTDSERLIDLSSLPQEVPPDETPAIRDIMDTAQSPVAQQFDTMINQSAQTHRQQLIDQLSSTGGATATPVAAPANNWFMGRSGGTAVAPAATTMPSVAAARAYTADEVALSERLKAQARSQQLAYGNLRTLQPQGGQPGGVPGPAVTSVGSASATATTPSDPAILSLANNDDLNVSTLAREAQRAKDEESGQNEVVISLH